MRNVDYKKWRKRDNGEKENYKYLMISEAETSKQGHMKE